MYDMIKLNVIFTNNNSKIITCRKDNQWDTHGIWLGMKLWLKWFHVSTVNLVLRIWFELLLLWGSDIMPYQYCTSLMFYKYILIVFTIIHTFSFIFDTSVEYQYLYINMKCYKTWKHHFLCFINSFKILVNFMFFYELLFSSKFKIILVKLMTTEKSIGHLVTWWNAHKYSNSRIFI